LQQQGEQHQQKKHLALDSTDDDGEGFHLFIHGVNLGKQGRVN
jgi:hypothetical protein